MHLAKERPRPATQAVAAALLWLASLAVVAEAIVRLGTQMPPRSETLVDRQARPVLYQMLALNL